MSAYTYAPPKKAIAKKPAKPAPATPSQREWISKVLNDDTRIMADDDLRDSVSAALADPHLSKKHAGILLDVLFALPRVDTGVTAGLYRDHEGTLYVVRANSAGTSHYALVLKGGRLDYVKGARNALTPDMRVTDAAGVPELATYGAGTYVGKKLRAAL